MKVKLIDNTTPRSDNIPGKPTDVSLGTVYEVAEVLNETGQYSIINDKMKIARYSQYRFEIVDDSPVDPLRDAFNMLTLLMRLRIKELEKQLEEATGN